MTKKQMKRLEKWLETNLHEVYVDLAPGCSEADLAEFENQIGVALPESLKDLYRMHDGQFVSANTGPFFGLIFLSLADARKHWESWKKVIDECSPGDMQGASRFCKSAKAGAIKEIYANKFWIPFAYDYGGNHLGVDLDPGERGNVGQVINFGRDEDEKFVLGSSVETFMEWLVEQLESGNAAIRNEDDGGRSLNTKVPEKFHFLDSVKILFASQRSE
ncbi:MULTISPECIES: SMI1/KNR4 family protein [Herbaspirillum]|uniref:SMI1/KNR4 family protein n=1 Tax=Herbaspirillum TaxID=963 RepID=UPI001E60CCA3|nr:MULTISPECIES: SMI1/KNR4 family protein [Herbaspirillum]